MEKDISTGEGDLFNFPTFQKHISPFQTVSSESIPLKMYIIELESLHLPPLSSRNNYSLLLHLQQLLEN